MNERLNTLNNDLNESNSSSLYKPNNSYTNNYISLILNLISNFLLVLNVFFHKKISFNYPNFSPISQYVYKSFTTSAISLWVFYYYNFNELKILIFKKVNFKPLLIRVLISFCMQLSITLMGNYLRLTTSSTIQGISPIITIFFAVILLNESISNRQIICLTFSIVGSLLITKPFSSSDIKHQDSITGIIWGLIFLISRALASVYSKILSNTLDLKIQLFVMNSSNFILSIALCIVKNQIHYSLYGVIYSCLAGLCLYFVQFLAFSALKFSDIVFCQLWYPSVILYGFFLSIFMQDSHDVYDYLGAIIIVFVSLYNGIETYKERENLKKVSLVE